jgi:hypothetical protein
MQRQGGGYGDDGGGNKVSVVALAATCAGIGWHNESGRGEEEDAVTTVAAKSAQGGRW